MRVMAIHTFGGPEVFKLENFQLLSIPKGHVRIQVKATSVNPLDCKIRAGALPEISPEFPAILHGDVAGVVTEVGPGVTRFQPGDAVYGYAGGVKGTAGALAESMIADHRCLAKKPHTLSFAQAAAMPLVTVTAWSALFLRARIKKGMHVLVHGGTGGVGHIGVQLAKWARAKVATTVRSEEDGELAQKLGAQEVINFQTESVGDYVHRLTKGAGFDAILDTVGGKNLALSFEAAALNGVIATTAARSTNDLSPMHNKGLSLHVVFTPLPLLENVNRKQIGKILEEAAELVDQGHLKPLVDAQEFSIWDVAKAHAYVESGKAKGKVVLTA